ncbi:rab GTPase-activating protein 1-like isoform X2 [Arapaima gigas]
MMEEVSIAAAYDAHVINRPLEEDLFSCLAANSKRTTTVLRQNTTAFIHKKLCLCMKSEKGLLLQRRSRVEKQDLLNRYKMEKRCLQEASSQLERENDDLAQKVVTSKITLRNNVEQAEDKVDMLSKELQLTKQHLVQTEDVKRKQEEENRQLKCIFRRELEKAESELKSTNATIDEYKKLCSQLSCRLTEQKVIIREELDLLMQEVQVCHRCQGVFSQNGSTGPKHTGLHTEKESLKAQLQELETELAQAKLQLVEAECEIQDLERQRRLLINEGVARRNTKLIQHLGSVNVKTSAGSQQTSSPAGRLQESHRAQLPKGK